MKKLLPKMTGQKTLAAASAIDGGLNLSLRPGALAPGESPDLLNFWRRDGALALRPGLQKLLEQSYGPVVGVYPKNGGSVLLCRTVTNGAVTQETRGIYLVTRCAVLFFDGTTVRRLPCAISYSGGFVESYEEYGFDGCVIIPSGSERSGALSVGGQSVSVRGEALYIFGGGYALSVTPQVLEFEDPAGTVHLTGATLVRPVTAHVPVRYEDCAPNGTGTPAEPRNLLSPANIQKFTSQAHATLYTLCESGLDNTPVTARYLADAGSVYTFSFPKDYAVSIQNGIAATLDRAAGTISLTSPLIDAAANGLCGNFSVTFSKTYPDCPVCRCTAGAWYDGGTQQGGGCGRVFLSGADAQQGGVPSRVYYSMPNDPTCFAADGFVDIGAPDDPVTAFGVQYDILAVFKKNAVYALTYSDTQNTAAFTVREVNAQVGCDAPKTLCLLSDTLVWLCGTGGVYALRSTTVRDERALVLLSRSVNKRLLALENAALASASAVCDGDSYFLLCGDAVFVLCRDNLRFTGEQARADWFFWSLPQALSGVFRYGAQFAASNDAGTVFFFDERTADDCGTVFEAFWRSKTLDFDAPHLLKKAVAISLTVGCEKPLRARLSFFDAAGETDCILCADGALFEKELLFFPPSAASPGVSVGISRLPGEPGSFCLLHYEVRAVGGANRFE